MRCPNCRNDTTAVVDSRRADDFTTRRRRRCDKCGHRFTTFERADARSKLEDDLDAAIAETDAALKRLRLFRSALFKKS